MHQVNRKVHHWVQCLVAQANRLLTETHRRALSSCSNGSGNRAHNFWWNKLSTLTVRFLEYIRINTELLMHLLLLPVASLLSCLHQLRSENIRLEEHVNNLIARRDHLLAVNARLAIPLNQVSQVQNQNSGNLNLFSILLYTTKEKSILNLLIYFSTLFVHRNIQQFTFERNNWTKFTFEVSTS